MAIYIADIDPFLDETAIKTALKAPNATIRIQRDPGARGGGGAFVTLPPDATPPQSHLFIGSSMCRVVQVPESDFEKPGKPQGEGIFIKNLAPTVQVDQLYDEFAKFGSIVALRIALNPYGVPRGFAYATFTTKDAVDAAIAQMNGQEHWGRKLYVGHNLPRRERVYKYEESKPEFTNLFIKGIGAQTQEQDFFDFFTTIGPIDSYSMPIDEYGVPRGFGFVNYKNHEDAVRAIQRLNNTKLGDRTIHVARAQQRDKPPKQQETPNLYIKNLSPEVTDEMLAQQFSGFGGIASAKVMMNEQGRSRGFGFVCFHDLASANAAIRAMNGVSVWGQPLYVALAQRKGRPWFSRQAMAPPMMPAYGVPMYMPMMMPMPVYPYYEGAPATPPPASGPSAGKPRRQQDYGSSLSAAVASAENDTAEKEVIGEALYPKVAKHEQVDGDELASLITGILLEEKKDDLLTWVDNDEMLNKRIGQAVDAYRRWKPSA